MSRFVIASFISVLIAPPATAAEDFEGRTAYFGELHAHTGYSGDGASADLGNCTAATSCGNVADFFSIARDAAGLDFASITDHITGDYISMSPSDWPAILDLVNDGHDEEGGFLALLGGEYLVVTEADAELGHKNLIFFADDAADGSIPYDELVAAGSPADCDDLWAAFDELDTLYGPLLLLPHHPAAGNPMPTRWACHDEILSPLVEIYSTHGNSRDTDTNDPWDPIWSFYEPNSTVNDALDPGLYGHHIGIMGGTDFHDTWPGLICHTDGIHTDQPYGGSITGVVLDGGVPFNRGNLYHGLRQRHTWGTSGPLVPVVMTLVDDDGAELALMGDVLVPPASPPTVRVAFADRLQPYVMTVNLYTIGRQTTAMTQVEDGVYELELDEVVTPWFGYAVLTVDGGSWYADQGTPCDDGGENSLEKIWTSPIWVEEADETDLDGDGYSEADGDCDDRYDAIHPDAAELANHLDDDCDGTVDEGTDGWDEDGDGYSPLVGDCDDTDDAVYPGAEDVCDDVTDNDCDGIDDPSEADADGDGVSICDGDCDDDNETVYPGADELLNGIDDDCDDEIDEDTTGDDDDSAMTDDDDDDDDIADDDDTVVCDDDCSCTATGTPRPAPLVAMLLAALVTLALRRR